MGRKPRSEEKILSTLLMAPASFKEIVERTGLPKATVSHAIRRLADKGVIHPEMIDGKITWFVTTRAALIMPMYRKETMMETLLTFLRLEKPPLKELIGEMNWETVFDQEKERARSPELKRKIEKMKELFAQAWPGIKTELSIMLSFALIFSLIIREKINSEEDLRIFKGVFLEDLFKDIMRPVKTKFLEILEAI